MTADQKLQQLIGAQIIQLIQLQTQLEEANKKIAELEKKNAGVPASQ